MLLSWSVKLDPGEVCGGVAKLKPVDPLFTGEDPFALHQYSQPSAGSQRLQAGHDARMLKASTMRRVRSAVTSELIISLQWKIPTDGLGEATSPSILLSVRGSM